MYPANRTKNWIIAYGVFGKTSSIDPPKTYNYHTAFDIKQPKVFYNVDLDMNQKKLTNVSLDTSDNNSAATVRMVKDLEIKVYLYITNYAYREIFEEFYDLIDTTQFNLIDGASGIVINKINPNLYLYNNKYISSYDMKKGFILSLRTLSIDNETDDDDAS